METNTDTVAWEAYRDALLRFVLPRVGNRAAAEDIVQEVLIKGFTRLASVREPSSIRAWLYQITRNEITDYYRMRKPTTPFSEDHFQEEGQTEDHRSERELAQCLLPLLEKVPEPYRLSLRLADIERIRQQEIASRLGISLSAAKSRIQRARSMLKDILLKCCRVELDRRGHTISYEPGEECNCSTSNASINERTQSENITS